MIKLVATLLKHSWLGFWRSKTLDRSLATTIFAWVMIGMLLLYALVLGFMLARIIGSIDPDTNPVTLVNSLLLFYWLFEFILRLLWQRNIALNAQYYLTQNIPRSALTHFMLLKSWANLFAFIALLLFGPFAWRQVAVVYNGNVAMLWLGGILLMSFLLHHLVIAIQQYTKGKITLPLLLGAAVIGLIYLNTQGYISLTAISEQLMAQVIANPAIILIMPVMVAAGYYIDFTLVKNNLSLDSLPQSTVTAGVGVSKWVAYLNKFGTVGQLLALELRLMWRNKRPRAILFSGVLLAFYFLLFLMRLDGMDKTFMAGTFLLLATGSMLVSYGQLLYSWESAYFDFLATRNFSAKTFLTGKFTLFLLFSTALLVVNGIIVALLNITMMKFLIVGYLLNSGFLTFIFIGGALLGPKRIDVNARAMFNYQGTTIFQFLIIIPYIFVPAVILQTGELLAGKEFGWLVASVPGLLGLVFYRPILGWLARLLVKRKYKILDGFRE